ncbi:hypothetical protein ACVWWG_005487 [Bradyrhizobium sp. LB7.2]
MPITGHVYALSEDLDADVRSGSQADSRTEVP